MPKVTHQKASSKCSPKPSVTRESVLARIKGPVPLPNNASYSSLDFQTMINAFVRVIFRT